MSSSDVKKTIIALLESEIASFAPYQAIDWSKNEVEELIFTAPASLLQQTCLHGYNLLTVYLFSKSQSVLKPTTLDVLIEKTLDTDIFYTQNNYIAAYLRQLKPLTPTQKQTLLKHSDLNILLSCDSDTLFSYAFIMANINKVKSIYEIFSDEQIEYILSRTDFEAKNDFGMRSVDVYMEELTHLNRLKPAHEAILFQSSHWSDRKPYLALFWSTRKDSIAAQVLFEYLEKNHLAVAQQLKKIEDKEALEEFNRIFLHLVRTPKPELFEYLILHKKIDTSLLKKLLSKYKNDSQTTDKSLLAQQQIHFFLDVLEQKERLTKQLPTSFNLAYNEKGNKNFFKI